MGIQSNLFWAITGAFIGLFLNWFVPFLWKKVRRWYFIHITKKDRFLILGPSQLYEKMNIGKLKLDFVVLQYGHYDHNHIKCIYNEREILLTPEFQELKNGLSEDIAYRLEQGELKLPYNGLNYKLLEFDTSYRDIINGEEVPVLKLKFAPTDYFTQLVTDLNLKNDYRNSIARKSNLIKHPVAEFASIVGINFNLITKDGYLIITQRSELANVNAGIYHTSVAENLSRPTDANPVNNAPDVFQCAIRGIHEEIGLDVEMKDIEFTVFGAYPKWCQYKLIGWSRIKETKAEVESKHSIAEAKDKWENDKLYFIPCNPKAIAEFINNTIDNWYDIGLACVVLSLFQMGFSHNEIEKAFLKANVRKNEYN